MSETIGRLIDLTGDGHGHHIPGTPYEWAHNWVPLNAAAKAEKAKYLAAHAAWVKKVESGHKEFRGLNGVAHVEKHAGGFKVTSLRVHPTSGRSETKPTIKHFMTQGEAEAHANRRVGNAHTILNPHKPQLHEYVSKDNLKAARKARADAAKSDLLKPKTLGDLNMVANLHGRDSSEFKRAVAHYKRSQGRGDEVDGPKFKLTTRGGGGNNGHEKVVHRESVPPESSVALPHSEKHAAMPHGALVQEAERRANNDDSTMEIERRVNEANRKGYNISWSFDNNGKVIFHEKHHVAHVNNPKNGFSDYGKREYLKSRSMPRSEAYKVLNHAGVRGGGSPKASEAEREAAHLARLPRPLNWNEMGSSEKDLWEERQLKAFRRFGSKSEPVVNRMGKLAPPKKVGPSDAEKIKNAEIMFGTGSKQHLAAIKRFTPKISDQPVVNRMGQLSPPKSHSHEREMLINDILAQVNTGKDSEKGINRATVEKSLSRQDKVDAANDAYLAKHGDSQSQHKTIDTGKTDERGNKIMAYTPERQKLHDEIVNEVLNEALKNGAKSEKKALFMGGLPGAGKGTILKGGESVHGLREKDYVVANPDIFKEKLAERGLIPQISDHSQMESSTVMHEEAADMAHQLVSESMKHGHNVAWDITMGSPGSVHSRLDTLAKNGYEKKNTQMIGVDVPLSLSRGRAGKRYITGSQAGGIGGRPVPWKNYDKLGSKSTNSANRDTMDLVKSRFGHYRIYDQYQNLTEEGGLHK